MRSWGLAARLPSIRWRYRLGWLPLLVVAAACSADSSTTSAADDDVQPSVRDCITRQVLASVGLNDSPAEPSTDSGDEQLAEALAQVPQEVIDLAVDVCALAAEAGVTPTEAASGEPRSAPEDRDAALPARLVEAPDEFDPGDDPPGTDEALDNLWAACGDGDPAACDSLFNQAPTGSPYEAFGFSCGGRDNVHCPSLLGGELSGAAALATDLSPESPAPGASAGLDNWWTACAEGSSTACAELVLTAPAGSDYFTFGRTCGGRTLGHCAGLLGVDGTPPSLLGRTPDELPDGDDAFLNALWDRCAKLSATACDDLTSFGPPDSEYVAFGASCGWRAVAPCTRLFAELADAEPDDT